jgi:site-specific DNA-methyltransferase (adenine-specific)
MKFNCSYSKLLEVHKLVPNPKNPNKHPEEQIDRLAKLIDYQGQRHPVIISNRSGFVVVGHGRLEAIKLLGWEKIAVDYQDFESEAQEYAFVVSDNAISEWASLDLAQINIDMLDLGPELDIEQLGIKDFVLEPVEKFDPQCDEDDVPEVIHPITRRGDVWLLGNHRLMCGDSTMIDDVEKLMNGEKADMVFTDPPYNVASDSKNFAADVSKSMMDLSNAEWDKGFEIETPTVNAILSSKDSATYYIWTSHFLFSRIIETLKKHCDFTSYLVWSNPNPMPSLSKRHPTWNTELCVYGTRGTKRVVNFPEDGHFLSCRSVIKKSDGSHPTQKPLELIEPLIDFSSGKGQLVLDLFLGSGSTLIVCEKTNRKCFGMELDEKYCDVIINRWQSYTGKKATLDTTGQTYEELKAERDGQTS